MEETRKEDKTGEQVLAAEGEKRNHDGGIRDHTEAVMKQVEFILFVYF